MANLFSPNVRTVKPLFLFPAILFAIKSLSAQDTIPSQHPPTQLDELKGFSQAYYHSKGHAARAKSIAVFMEKAGSFFQEELSFSPQVTLFILAPRDWKAIAAKPLQEVYGFPHNIDSYRLAVASEDNDLWRSFLPPTGSLPPEIGKEVDRAYGLPDGTHSMMPFFDLLALHEMGHSYTSQVGLKMHRHWMGELFVNIMLHTYVAEKQPELLPVLETFPNMVVGMGAAEYQFTSLEDFERLYSTLGMGPKNYGWYQCRLHSAAREIYNQGGKLIMKKLWIALKSHQQDMSDADFAEMLMKEVHPAVANVYLKWNIDK